MYATTAANATPANPGLPWWVVRFRNQRHKARRQPRINQVCVRNSQVGVPTPRRKRWLAAYPDISNGLGNRLGGIRASFWLAHVSGRQFALRWREWLEGAYLRPPAESLCQWTLTEPAVGLADGSDGRVRDAWSSGPVLSSAGKLHWTAPWTDGGATLLELPPDATHARRLRDKHPQRMCVPMVRHTSPRERLDMAEWNDFTAVANGAQPLVITVGLFHDVGHPLWKQRDVVSIAFEQYKQILAPTPSFLREVCRHLDLLQLSLARPWVGLQLRVNPAISGLENEHRARLDISLKFKVESAVTCAMAARDAACRMDATMCGAPIFLTSNSYLVLRYAARKVGRDARYTANSSFGYHGAPGHYLPALLEMAVLSASAVLIATAGSTFPLEAANLANTTALVQDFGMYPIDDAILNSSVQGQCDRPLLARQQSVLLPRDACSARPRHTALEHVA